MWPPSRLKHCDSPQQHLKDETKQRGRLEGFHESVQGSSVKCFLGDGPDWGASKKRKYQPDDVKKQPVRKRRTRACNCPFVMECTPLKQKLKMLMLTAPQGHPNLQELCVQA